MFVLVDAMNGRQVSRHRTVEAAAAADRRLQRSLHRSSPGSYLPTAYAIEVVDGPGIHLGGGTYFGVGRLGPVPWPPEAIRIGAVTSRS